MYSIQWNSSPVSPENSNLRLTCVSPLLWVWSCDIRHTAKGPEDWMAGFLCTTKNNANLSSSQAHTNRTALTLALLTFNHFSFREGQQLKHLFVHNIYQQVKVTSKHVCAIMFVRAVVEPGPTGQAGQLCSSTCGASHALGQDTLPQVAPWTVHDIWCISLCY